MAAHSGRMYRGANWILAGVKTPGAYHYKAGNSSAYTLCRYALDYEMDSFNKRLKSLSILYSILSPDQATACDVTEGGDLFHP